MKPNIILQLEKELNIVLNEVQELDDFGDKPEYTVNKSGQIINLCLSNLNLKQVPASLLNDDFNYLETLDLSNNNILDISNLKGLKKITSFFISNNKIIDISPVENFTELVGLALSSNKIIDITPISNLNKLQFIELSNNKIVNISALSKLHELYNISLNNNKISDISPLKELSKLATIDLQNNNIKTLPAEVFYTLSESSINFSFLIKDLYRSNPIENPPIEILTQGKEAIKNYFEELEKGTVNLFETKLLLVGYGAVGKTSLMKRLVLDEYNENESSTEGIEIKRWNLKTQDNKELKINIWDFGGQEIYHSTHQFFLSKRSIYLLVWDARIDKMMPNLASFDYWLRIVSLLSQNSPILVVQNKIDERASLVAEKYMQEYFPNIVGFYKVSTKEKTGIVELKNAIQNEISKLPHIGERLPKVWIDIRDNLKQSNQNFIQLENYISVCKDFGIDFEQALHLSNYFHDLGIFLHFQDNDILRNIIFLNPEWATKAVYKIIDTKEVVLNQGKFNYSQLRNIWNDYPNDKFAFLIELMKKFELCFLLPNGVDYIVPELLPPNQPDEIDNWDNSNNLRFEFRYKFMPAGIITRLIVRMHDYIENDLFWKQGVLIEREETEAVITSNIFERKISVKIKGKHRQDLFGIIRYEIENIHKTLKEPNVQLMTHCICNECFISSEPEFYTFEQLNKFFDRGKKTIECRKSAKDVSINKLLGKVNGEGTQQSLFDYIVIALKQLQGLSLNIQKYEDSRNSFIANVLTNKNFRAKDQTKWGKAEIQPGEIDIKIEDERGDTIAIYEAFNLKDFDKISVRTHLKKIFNYDANGLPENYLVAYCSKNFIENWNKYIMYIQTIDYEHKMIDFTDISNNFDIPTNLKIGIARHKRNEKEIKIYHIFVELQTNE